MPASPLVVAPSSYFPKMATTSRTLSSQTLWYSGNLPVVFSEETVTRAETLTTSSAASVQPKALGR